MSNNLQAGQQTQSTRATTVRQNSKGKKVWQHWKLVLGILIGIVLLFFWRGCALEYKANAPARAEAERAEAEAKKAEASQETPTQPELGQEVRLRLSDKDWSQPVFVSIGRCITWHRTNPDDPPAAVEAKDNNGQWYGWDDYQKLRSIGTVGNPAWFRFKATVPSQGLGYEIRPDGHCS